MFPNCFSESNVTNLHYHGMHVEQGESGDDVLLAIYPYGQDPASTSHEEHGMTVKLGRNDYDFVVPDDHPQGTFWYHPHKHGATDIQVANGMAGALIVNDTLNDEPEFRDRPPAEQVLVIQAILPDLNFPNPAQQFVSGTLTVNGVTNPAITMKAGEVQRWRLINATGAAASAFELTLAGEGHPDDNAPEMYIIAVDGNFLDQSHWDSDTPTRAVFLAPGNRADVLVYAPEEGQFTARVRRTINNQRNAAVNATSAAQSTPTALPAKIAFPFAPLLAVHVEGQMTPPMTLPARLPPLPHQLRPFGPGEVDACARNLTFELLGGSGGGAKQGTAPRWAINGKQFDPGRVDQCMLLGTSETWTLINTTPVAHPFHIHLNPFLVEQFYDPTPNDPQNPRTTGDNPVGQWQDTIIIPGATFDQKSGQIMEPGIVVIRHRFVDFTGKFVLHCHILGHEDRGMMQLLEVVKDAKDCKSGGNCPILYTPTETPAP
jgi:FtsP/CotA-like multicopper oxidase with cupredoxin domain